MGGISIVNGKYKPTYNWGGTTLYVCLPEGIPKNIPKNIPMNPQNESRKIRQQVMVQSSIGPIPIRVPGLAPQEEVHLHVVPGDQIGRRPQRRCDHL